MAVLIDTNLWYYAAGISLAGGVDTGKLVTELNRQSGICVSDISIIELVSHWSDPQNVAQCVDYSLKNEHRFVCAFTFGTSVVEELIYQHKANYSDYQNFRKSIVNQKKSIESELLRFCIESLEAAYAHILEKDSQLDSDSKKQKFSAHVHALILGNRPFVLSQITDAIEAFYASEDSGVFKDEVESLLSLLLFALHVSFSASSENDWFYNESAMDSFKREDPTHRKKDHAIRGFEILSKRPNSTQLFKKNLVGLIESYRTEYEREMEKSIPVGVVKYYSAFMKKLLTEPRRIDRNDLLDSQLMNFWGVFELLTIDRKFLSIIELMDPGEYERIRKFILSIQQ